MKKLVNRPDTVVTDALAVTAAAHPVAVTAARTAPASAARGAGVETRGRSE